MNKINQYALKKLTEEDVFCYKLVVCDNAVDRTHEVFTAKCLEKLAKMLVGKTMISDHSRKAENQCARIYSTYIENASGSTGTDESYSRLVACCYMLRTESNKDLIAEIEAGIKKEASVSCRVRSINCSVCGVNNRDKWCEHMPGKSYDGVICHFKLEDPQDAYEVSFVAVPAQPKAGTMKDYGGVKEESKLAEEKDVAQQKSGMTAQRLRASQMYVYTKKAGGREIE